MINIVIDTNVLVSALKSDMGASYALVSALPSPKFQFSISVPFYSEYQDVLTRKEHLTGASTEKEILALLTQDYLENEAAKGKRKDFTKVLKDVPHTEPEPHEYL